MKPFIIGVFSFLFVHNNSAAQCIANAGGDVIVCSSWDGMGAVTLGGDPVVIGGIPPYTYAWETNWDYFQWTNTASYFLDDTTLANPTTINTADEELVFHLTVTDSLQNTCHDSVLVGFSNFGTHLGNVTYYIVQGDSAPLNLGNVGGGIPPLEYLWRPNHGLTDSTSLSTWASPDTSVNYYITATDSAGCVAVGSPNIFVVVSPVGISERADNEAVSIFPNPVSDILYVRNDNQTSLVIRLFDADGRQVRSMVSTDKLTAIDLTGIPVGTYVYEVLAASGKMLRNGKFIRR